MTSFSRGLKQIKGADGAIHRFTDNVEGRLANDMNALYNLRVLEGAKAAAEYKAFNDSDRFHNATAEYDRRGQNFFNRDLPGYANRLKQACTILTATPPPPSPSCKTH